MKKQQLTPFEAACKALKISTNLPDVSGIDEDFRKPVLAHHQLMVIIKAKKAGHKFDWNNNGERKYSPWVDLETYGNAPAGSGFSFCDCDHDHTFSSVGSRLSSRSSEDAKQIFDENIDLYRDMMTE